MDITKSRCVDSINTCEKVEVHKRDPKRRCIKWHVDASVKTQVFLLPLKTTRVFPTSREVRSRMKHWLFTHQAPSDSAICNGCSQSSGCSDYRWRFEKALLSQGCSEKSISKPSIIIYSTIQLYSLRFEMD